MMARIGCRIRFPVIRSFRVRRSRCSARAWPQPGCRRRAPMPPSSAHSLLPKTSPDPCCSIRTDSSFNFLQASSPPSVSARIDSDLPGDPALRRRASAGGNQHDFYRAGGSRRWTARLQCLCHSPGKYRSCRLRAGRRRHAPPELRGRISAAIEPVSRRLHNRRAWCHRQPPERQLRRTAATTSSVNNELSQFLGGTLSFGQLAKNTVNDVENLLHFKSSKPTATKPSLNLEAQVINPPLPAPIPEPSSWLIFGLAVGRRIARLGAGRASKRRPIRTAAHRNSSLWAGEHKGRSGPAASGGRNELIGPVGESALEVSLKWTAS